MRTIDGLLERGELAPPDVVKIDVEGAELLVLEGMRRTLAAHRPALVVELHDTRSAFEAFLAEAGYRITGGAHDQLRNPGNDHVFAEPQ